MANPTPPPPFYPRTTIVINILVIVMGSLIPIGKKNDAISIINTSIFSLCTYQESALNEAERCKGVEGGKMCLVRYSEILENGGDVRGCRGGAKRIRYYMSKDIRYYVSKDIRYFIQDADVFVSPFPACANDENMERGFVYR